MKWYADNSDLNGIKGAEIPDILLFGGLIVSPETERHIQTEVEKIKHHYSGDSRTPIKWNLKDLQKLPVGPKYDQLINVSRELRIDVFKCLAETDCRVLISCVEGYSAKRHVLTGKKEKLTSIIFSNGLMRYGIHVQKEKPQAARVILDWPDKNDSAPFDSEYARAYRRGKTTDRVDYDCGPLSGLGFADSVMFTRMQHSTLLQVADLIVGATREFLQCCLDKKQGGQGLDCLRLIRDRFRGAPGQIVGRGLVIPSGNKQLSASVEKGIEQLLYAK